MCVKKEKIDTINKVVGFSEVIPSIGELNEFPDTSIFNRGNGTYKLEYLLCDCTFDVIYINGITYNKEIE